MDKQGVEQINLTEDEKIDTILKNTITMLRNRRYEKPDGTLDPVVSKTSNPVAKGDNTWTLEANDGNEYAIKIVFQTVTVTGKQSPLSDFLANYPDHYKIVIVSDYNMRIETYLKTQKAQIFREFSLLQDLASHIYQPKFIKLSSKEAAQVVEEYNLKKTSMPLFTKTDPMYKYFDMKMGDVFRIISASPASGDSVAYRAVKN